MKRVAAIVAPGLVGGCTVGPDFVRPDTPRDETYLTGPETGQTVDVPNVLSGDAQRFVADLDIPAQWWQVYQWATDLCRDRWRGLNWLLLGRCRLMSRISTVSADEGLAYRKRPAGATLAEV